MYILLYILAYIRTRLSTISCSCFYAHSELYVQMMNPITRSNSATEGFQNALRGARHLYVISWLLVPCIFSLFRWLVGLIVAVWRAWRWHQVLNFLTIFFFSAFPDRTSITSPEDEKRKTMSTRRKSNNSANLESSNINGRFKKVRKWTEFWKWHYNFIRVTDCAELSSCWTILSNLAGIH